MTDYQLNEDEFEFPLRISTHERCSDPCPEYRDRFKGREEFEFIGMWGPLVETAAEETIAVGHKSVGLVLDAVLDDGAEENDPKICGTWDCDNEASHTVEYNSETSRYTAHRCPECVQSDKSSMARVDEGLEIEPCDRERCFNAVHESRVYCVQHE